MFGMGFTEILLIAVIAIIALGPEKLPTAMVEIAKFIKKLKSGIDDAKTTLDTELNISEMKKEADKFKSQIENVKTEVRSSTQVDLGLEEIVNDDLSKETKKKKKPKKKKEENTQIENASNNTDIKKDEDEFKVDVKANKELK